MRFLTLLVVSMLAFTCPCEAAATAVQKLSSASLASSSSSSSSHTFHTLAEDLSSPKLNMLCSNKNIPSGTQYITIENDPNDKEERKGREGKIMVIAVSHEITSPRDPQSGLPTGRRQHRPFVFYLPVGPSTPSLYRALTTGSTFKSLTLEQYTSTTPKETIQGQQTLQATTILNQAQIASIERNGNELTVHVTYNKIQWTWTDGGVTHDDTWEARK